MDKIKQMSFIVSHLPELTALFHGLFRIGSSSTRQNKTNVIRYNILKCLEVHGTQYLTDISACVHYKKNTLSELLQRMVSDGLVKREADSRDRRKTDFTLNAAGVRAIKDFERKFVRNMDGFLSALPEKFRVGFLECLGSLVQISRSCAEEIIGSQQAKTKSR